MCSNLTAELRRVPRDRSVPHVAAIADSETQCWNAHGSEFRFRSFIEDDVGIVIAVERDKRAGKSRKLASLARGQEAAIVTAFFVSLFVWNVVFVHGLLLLLVFAEIATKVTHAPAIHNAPDA